MIVSHCSHAVCGTCNLLLRARDLSAATNDGSAGWVGAWAFSLSLV
jgi:hypothetical protein